MIDLDQMEEQLARAVNDDGPRAPAARPAPVATTRFAAASQQRQRVRSTAVPGPVPADVAELLELGLVAQADARIAATTDAGDAATWATMRALLEGRHTAVRTGLDRLRDLARDGGDASMWDRYWSQRFWAALEWGGDGERQDVLDHCRERAYRFDEAAWWGNLTLLLATLGKGDEATRAFDAAAELVGPMPKDRGWLDVITNLVEGAALLGDRARVARAQHAIAWPDGRLIVVGPGVVCKGSIDRYRGLAFAAAGRWAEATSSFDAAAAAHRALGAGPLLARTLQQAEQAQVAA